MKTREKKKVKKDRIEIKRMEGEHLITSIQPRKHIGY